MSELTAEQLRQIERNKALAMLKKKNSSLAANACGASSNLTGIRDDRFKKVAVVDAPKKTLTVVNSAGTKPSVSSSPVSATCRLVTQDKFIVDMPFHGPSIEVFKTIPGKQYDPTLKKWMFPLTSYDILISKLKGLATVDGIPSVVLRTFLNSSQSNGDDIDLSKIDKPLLDTILPFQEEGIRFGISKKGRCLIADDMGLGKTIQALGIARYYKENWPLLIACPSSMRFQWEEAIQVNLPSVNAFYIVVMTSSKDIIDEAEVVICSYDLLKTRLQDLLKKKFGVIIIDESHSLKNLKTARTKAALQLIKKCRNVILLSGTPVLSRPVELYPQIIAVDPFSFPAFHDFGIRYCDGKKDKFGWNFFGSSNMEELELFLKRRIMIRRVKSEVLSQLPSKMRKVVVLNPTLVKAVTKQMKKFAADMESQKGGEKRSTLLSFYSLTAEAKLKAVCEYIEDRLESSGKFLVFAHHSLVIRGLCDMLDANRVDHIKIDGTTNPELRKTLCDRFQSDESCRVAVLSILAANSGLTLTAAQLVIFAELYWNPGELTQAEDRAHRIGQTDSVIVEYLVAKGTADEHIWSLVQSKLKVLNKAGLSKDNFKEVDTKHMGNEIQLTMDQLFKSEKKVADRESPEMKANGGFFADKETQEMKQNGGFFADDMDDDLFASTELDEIENEYYSEKKRKIEV